MRSTDRKREAHRLRRSAREGSGVGGGSPRRHPPTRTRMHTRAFVFRCLGSTQRRRRCSVARGHRYASLTGVRSRERVVRGQEATDRSRREGSWCKRETGRGESRKSEKRRGKGGKWRGKETRRRLSSHEREENRGPSRKRKRRRGDGGGRAERPRVSSRRTRRSRRRGRSVEVGMTARGEKTGTKAKSGEGQRRSFSRSTIVARLGGDAGEGGRESQGRRAGKPKSGGAGAVELELR